MTPPSFLIDENVPAMLKQALLSKEPSMDLLTVGDSGAPPKRTQDADLLIAAERLQRAFITMDKNSMVGHLVDHYAAGLHTHGAFMLRQEFPLNRYVDDLLLIWHSTTADDWIDQTQYLPF